MNHFTAIVAYDRNRGVGKNNQLPWHLPQDLKHFKETTKNGVLIMGRKTWESLPLKPLPDRKCIVVSSTQTSYPGALVFNNPEAALRAGLSHAMIVDKELFVIGGPSLYEYFKHRITRQIVTELDWVEDCDAFYPQEIPGNWVEDQSLRKGFQTEKGTATIRYLIKSK